MNSLGRAPLDDHLDGENPWPGLAAFQEENRAFFFGREQEIQQFARLVRRELLCVLFGKSGLGKSSLLKAGLFPLLREELYVPIYIRLNHVETTPALVEQVSQAICATIEQQGIDAPLPEPGETFWQYFHRRDVDWWDGKNRLLTPVLIFDQFEEILTLGFENLTRSDRSRALLTELEDVVENRIPDKDRSGQNVNQRVASDPEYRKRFVTDGVALRIILTLREDFLPDLEELRGRLRPVLLNRFRLLPMTEEQARSVITGPSPGLVREDAVDHILTALSSAKSVFRAKHSDLFDREFDPALLSVVCQQLNNHRREKGEKQITANVVIQGKEEILRAFYETGFDGLPKEARFFVEDHLLDESGFRVREALQTALNRPGISEDIIAQLINRRLLRQEMSLGHEWLELSHDVLAGVAKESRTWRRNQELLWKARRRLITSIVAGAGLCIVAIVLAVFLLRYQHDLESLRRANERFLVQQAGQLLTNAANRHETAAVYKLRRQLADMRIEVPQTDALLTLLPPQRWKLTRIISLPTTESIRDIAFSPDGEYLAALTVNGNLFISDKCRSDSVPAESKSDFRQVLQIGTSSAKNGCRAIAFDPTGNDHRLTVRTVDSQISTLDCASFGDGSETQPPDKSGHLEAEIPTRIINDVADLSIRYIYDRLFILSDDYTLRVQDKHNNENEIALSPDLLGTGSDQNPKQLRLFESGESCESSPALCIWRDGTFNVASLDKDFRKVTSSGSGEVPEPADQFAVGPTGLVVEYDRADNSLKITSYLPARQIFNIRLKDLGDTVEKPSAIAVGTSSDILVCSADGTIQNFLLNPGGSLSVYATLRAPASVTAISFRRDQTAFVTGSSTGQVLIWSKCNPPIGQSTLPLVSNSTENADQLTVRPGRWNISPSGRLLVVEQADGIYSYELRKENSSPVLPQKKLDRRTDELYLDVRVDDDGRITTLTSTNSRDELRIRRDSVGIPAVMTDVDFSAWPVLSPEGKFVGYISRGKASGDKQLTVRDCASGAVKVFPLGEMAQTNTGSSAAFIAFDCCSRRAAIFDPQLERLAVFDLANPTKEPDSIPVPLTSHLEGLHFTKDSSGLILSFNDSTLALVDISSPLLLGPFAVPGYSIVGDSPAGIVVFDRDGKSNGYPGFAILEKGADDQIERELEPACFGSKISKKNGIYEGLESLDDFRRQVLQRESVSRFSSQEAEKWEQLRTITRRLTALPRSSSAKEVFQILDKIVPLLKAELFPDEYEPRVLQIAWRVSRNLHDENLAALPPDEFERLPPKLRVIFDNTITTLNPNERSVKVQRACDLADLFSSGEKRDPPSADECLRALNEAVDKATADDLDPTDKERIKRHFVRDLRNRSDFPVDLLIEKTAKKPTGEKAPLKTGPRE